MFSVIIYFADLSKFFPDHDVEFLFFAIGSTMVGFGLGATWILNKKVKIEFDRDKK